MSTKNRLRVAAMVLLAASWSMQSASGQTRLAIEASAGVGMPGITSWAGGRSVGPAATIGVSRDLSKGLGWIATINWNRFTFRETSADNIDQFISESTGDIVTIVTSDVEGGDFAMVSLVAGLRRLIDSSTQSPTYLMAGLVFGAIRQDSATVFRTTQINGEAPTGGRTGWISEYRAVGVGPTIRVGFTTQFTRSLSLIGEAGYEILFTPGESSPGNLDFFPVSLGLKYQL